MNYDLRPIMQNKPNLLNARMNVTTVLTRDYGNMCLRGRRKNKAKTNPNKPNLPNAQMNVSSVITKDYENEPLCARRQNKPNQTQFQTPTQKMTKICKKNLIFKLVSRVYFSRQYSVKLTIQPLPK